MHAIHPKLDKNKTVLMNQGVLFTMSVSLNLMINIQLLSISDKNISKEEIVINQTLKDY